MNVLALRFAEWIAANPIASWRLGWILFGVAALAVLATAAVALTADDRRQRRKERGMVRQAELICAHAARHPANGDD